MCGIAGKLWFDRERPADAATVGAMLARMVHRGPDDQGLAAAGPIALGQRRLSIVDLSAAGHKAETIQNETVLFDGTARQICPLYPRNVNSHAAVALAGVGFDRTRSVLIADPNSTESIIELEARGGGIAVQIRRANPMQGVSGVFTLISTLASIGRAKAAKSGLRIC